MYNIINSQTANKCPYIFMDGAKLWEIVGDE